MALFIPNPLGIKAVGVAPYTAEATLSVAERIALTAQAIAPVRTGFYAASIHAEPEVTATGAGGRVTASAPYSIYIEFGTEDTPTFQPLRRAMESVRL